MEDLNLAEVTFPGGFEDIEKVISGYQRYQVLQSALEFGLFEQLEKRNGAEQEEITSFLSLNGMLTRSYLRCLVQMGFLSQDKDRYQNTSLSRQFLIPSSPTYQGDLISQTSSGSSRWTHLHLALRVQDGNVSSTTPGPSLEFLRALAQRTMQGETQNLIKTIATLPSFPSCTRMLDIGGGHGLHSIGLCQLNEHIHATILDQSHVVSLAPVYVRQFGMSGRVDALEGDICTMELKPEYDIILVSHLLYKFRDQLPSIFSRIHNGLKPGGVFVSNHWFCSSGCVPLQDATVELERSMQSAGHPLCHQETFEELFASQGMKVIFTGTIPGAYGEPSVHIGQKE